MIRFPQMDQGVADPLLVHIESAPICEIRGRIFLTEVDIVTKDCA